MNEPMSSTSVVTHDGANAPTRKPICCSTCHVLFVFDGDAPSASTVVEAWNGTRGSGLQSSRLHDSVVVTTNGKTTMLFTASYGPVRGNSPSDYDKVKRVAERVGAVDGQAVKASFTKWRAEASY